MTLIKKSKKRKGEKYFTKITEQAIIEYNSTSDSILRNKIYNEHIHYAFSKLIENIIHTFKFYYTEVDDLKDLQHEVITFLLSKIHKFDPTNGAKAYSYFGTIVKHYLILHNNKNYKKLTNHISIDILESEEEEYFKIPYETKVEISTPTENLIKYINTYVDFCSKNIYTLFPKKYDAQIADAILELFRKREYLNLFNKKAMYIYIKEIVIDVKTSKITQIAARLHSIFKQGYVFYLENGYIEFTT
jgi:hypothetical protein